MFLPVDREDMEKRGWDEVDFVLVTGDAYVDHPSFGTAVIVGFWSPMDIKRLFFHSPNGKIQMISGSSADQDLGF